MTDELLCCLVPIFTEALKVSEVIPNADDPSILDWAALSARLRKLSARISPVLKEYRKEVREIKHGDEYDEEYDSALMYLEDLKWAKENIADAVKSIKALQTALANDDMSDEQKADAIEDIECLLDDAYEFIFDVFTEA